VLQRGLPLVAVTTLDAGLFCGSATGEAGRGEAVGLVFAGLDEQAVSASAAATAASRHKTLTPSTVARLRPPAESQQPRRHNQAWAVNV
jgi:hypothetical protein